MKSHPENLAKRTLNLQRELIQETQEIDKAFRSVRKNLLSIKKKYAEIEKTNNGVNKKVEAYLQQRQWKINEKLELLDANHNTVMTIMED